MVRWLRLSIVLAVLAGGAIAAWYWPALPERVASHFDGAGRPNGWSSKESFVGLMLGMTVFHAALFLGIEQLVRRAPAKWINLPHKEEWLAPARAGGRQGRSRAARRAVSGAFSSSRRTTIVTEFVTRARTR